MKTPTPDHQLAAQQLYQDALYEAELTGVLTDSDMYSLMLSNNLWSALEENELTTSSNRMDALKEEMFKKYAAFQSSQVEKLRHLLNRMRKRTLELFRKRHSYDLYTCSGLASIYQLQYLLANNTFYVDGNPVQQMDDTYIRILCEQYIANKPNDTDLRQLSKIDTWRSIWHAAKGAAGNLFGIPAINLSDEQRGLIGWSRLYDNVQEAYEPPDKVIVDDDDLLDGWLITQHKRREAELKERQGDNHKNGAQELFIPVETDDDRRRVEAMNDSSGQILKKQRLSLVKQQGSVAEQNMPDSQQKIIMQATQAFHAKMRQR